MEFEGFARGKLVAGLLTAFLAACGGGGGGGSAGSEAAPSQAEIDKAQVMLATGLFDATTGFERMLTLAGIRRMVIADVVPAETIPCPGGGAITTRKPTGLIFELEAASCVMDSASALTFNGLWRLTQDSLSNFMWDGNCSDWCVYMANLDHSTARFGYGAATEPVFGNVVSLINNGHLPGLRFEFRGNEAWSLDGVSALVGGNLNKEVPFEGTMSSSIVLNGAGFSITAPTNGPITMNGPQGIGYPAAKLYAGPTGVFAEFDRDRNGIVEASFLVPWSDFR